MITCPKLRRSVFTALVLLGAGALLLIISNLLLSIVGGFLSLIIGYIGLTLIVGSPLTMLITLVRSLLPGSRKNLEACIH